MADSFSVTVLPKDQQPPMSRKTVRLYFIGTRLLREGKHPPILHIRGRAYRMPPIGESIEVDELTVREITQRCEWREANNPIPIPGVTTSPEVAAAVKAAFERGEVGTLDVRQMVEANAVKSVDTELLLAELRRRGADVSELISASQAESVSEPPDKPKRGRPSGT